MTSPILAMRHAIIAAAEADDALRDLMGGAVKIFDEAPRSADPVYAVFGDVKAADWSTDNDRGHEQNIALIVWGEEGSAGTALAAAERLALVLHDAALSLDGHRLVQLRVTELSCERDKDTRRVRATLRLRAVTEVM